MFKIIICIKFWFQAASACVVPRNDLELFKELKKYEKSTLAKKAINKMFGYLWYISEKLIVLSFLTITLQIQQRKIWRKH